MGFRSVGMLVVLGLLLLFSVQTSAQNVTRYVSDQLEVGVRTGKTLQNRIIHSARSGDRVTVLQQDADGHSRIRFEDGTEGWILTRYLQDEPHSRELLAEVTAELEEIRAGTDDQGNRVAQLLETRDRLQAERQALQARVASLEAELEQLGAIASRPQEIRETNAQLRSSLLEAQHSAEDLRRQVEVLRADSQRKWFMTGALVTVVSLILGILLTRIPRRRRSSEW